MSIFISPLIAKLLFVCTITVVVMTTTFFPSSSLSVMAATGDITFDSRDSTTISGASYTNMKYCVGLSTNDGNDAICTSSQHTLVKTTLAPFAFSTESTVTGSNFFLPLESEDLVAYGTLSGAGPFTMTANYFTLSTLAAKSTATKTLGTTTGIPNTGDGIISSTQLLFCDQVKTLYRCDLTNLADDCKSVTHGTSGLSQMTADETATHAYILNAGTKIQQFNVNSGSTSPTFKAEVTFPNAVSTSAYLFYKKFSADNVEKVYTFDSNKLIVATITSGTMATPVEHALDTYDKPLDWFAVAFAGDSHLLVAAASPSAVYSIDLSDNRRVQSSNVACTGATGTGFSMVYVSSTNKIHTLVNGDQKCLYSFTEPTPAPTPAPTAAPGNQQANVDGASLSESQQEAVIGVTAAVGAIGVIAIVGMIVYTVCFKNKAADDDTSSGGEGDNAPDDSKNNENTV